MADNEMNNSYMDPEDRPIQFRTILILYILLGAGIGLTIHFILLSTPVYNWLQ